MVLLIFGVAVNVNDGSGSLAVLSLGLGALLIAVGALGWVLGR
jgi:hypothetical protein